MKIINEKQGFPIYPASNTPTDTPDSFNANPWQLYPSFLSSAAVVSGSNHMEFGYDHISPHPPWKGPFTYVIYHQGIFEAGDDRPTIKRLGKPPQIQPKTW